MSSQEIHYVCDARPRFTTNTMKQAGSVQPTTKFHPMLGETQQKAVQELIHAQNGAPVHKIAIQDDIHNAICLEF